MLMLGAGRGIVTLMRPMLIAARYGRTHFGAIAAVVALFVSLAAAPALVGAGLVVDRAGHGVTFLGLPVVSAIAAAAMLRAA